MIWCTWNDNIGDPSPSMDQVTGNHVQPVQKRRKPLTRHITKKNKPRAWGPHLEWKSNLRPLDGCG